MAKKKSLILSEGNIIGSALLILLFVILIITFVRKTYWSSYWNGVANEYQSEVNKIVTPDFTLVSSRIKNEGIDVGTVLTDDYTTHLSYANAMAILLTNAHKSGYKLSAAQCFGGYEFTGNDGGTLAICETKYEKGVTTFEFSLNSLSSVSSPKAQGTCVGDCKQ